MAGAAKKSLQTLQGLLDEGLISKAEYTQRRKTVLDAVTTPAVAAAGPSKGSVFDRLGGDDEATGSTGGGAVKKWGHDGFASLYGGGGGGQRPYTAKPGGGANRKLASAISKSSSKRAVTRVAPKGDLRAKLQGGARGGGAHSKKLPAKCPW